MINEKSKHSSKLNIKTLGLKKIYTSLTVILLILASLTGATYAWFTHQINAGDTTFVAGTVQLSKPEIIDEDLFHKGSSVKHGFVPNSGEASISKVDLVTYQEIARYYTAPRVDDLLGFDGSTSEWVYNEVKPYDWRTSRIAQDASGNPWVLNVGAEQDDLQGSVVRVQANTAGLSNTHSLPGDILSFGTDDAVQVYPVGNRGDMPRAIAIDDEGYIWVGFYSGGYLAKYSYDGTNLTLVATFRYHDGDSNNIKIKFYEMKFAPDGTLWISSRNSTPSRPGTSGIFSFDGTNFKLENSVNPYSLLIAADGTVYATAFGNQLYIFDGSEWSQETVGNQNRGMAFDDLGNIWIASTEGVSGGTTIYSYNVASGNPGLNYTLTSGTTPVGIGKDPFGNMWAICRSDLMAQGWIEGFDPSDQTKVGAIQVGYRPYAYGDFTLVDNTCKTVRWSFKNEGTKRVYVRVKPTATLNGISVNITFCEDETKWKIGNDGWYYFGDEAGPTMVSAPDTSNPDANVVNVCFKYCFAADTGFDLIVKLEAQAVQSSNNAIDHEWVSHPWFNLTQ